MHLGVFQFLIALIFTGSILILSLLIMSFRYFVSVTWNSHLLTSVYMLNLRSLASTWCTCSLCSRKFWLYINMLSRYVVQNQFRYSHSTLLIKCYHKMGLLVSLNSRTFYLYAPNRVIIVVRSSKSTAMHSLWNACQILIFVNTFAWLNWARFWQSMISGMYFFWSVYLIFGNLCRNRCCSLVLLLT